MSLQPVQPEEQVQKACQVGLAVLELASTSIPGNLYDAIGSFKQLLRGVIQGQLILCQQPKTEGEGTQEPPKKIVRKKKSKLASRLA